MKKYKVLLLMVTLVFACTACGGKKDKMDEKTEQNTTSEQSENVDMEESNIYTIISETEDTSVEITIPEEFKEMEYSSDQWLVMEAIGENTENSIQLAMGLKSDEIDNVGQSMFEEVRYLMSANSDTDTEIGESILIHAANHEWAYITYGFDGLKGYKIWAEIENKTVLAGTIEVIGEKLEEFDIETFIHQIDETIKVD